MCGPVTTPPAVSVAEIELPGTRRGLVPTRAWRQAQGKPPLTESEAADLRDMMGAVVAEETTHGIRTLRNRALEKLFNVILTIMSMGTLALFFFLYPEALQTPQLHSPAASMGKLGCALSKILFHKSTKYRSKRFGLMFIFAQC